MADVLLNVVIEGVLNKLISLVAEEINIVWGVKEDLESLARNLEMIQALLLDAECKHNSGNAVDLWLRGLQDVSSKADDLLDEFAYEVLRSKLKKRKQDQVRSFFFCSCPLGFRFKFAHKIKNMNLSIEKVYQEAERIGLRPVEIVNMSNNPRSDRSSTTDPFVDDSSIVGRSEEVNKVVNLLTSSEKDGNKLSVIGIVGMAGLGKTTIAQLVYKNEKVLRHFDHKLWIHVSKDFKVERLLNKMVESLMGTNPNLTVGEAIDVGRNYMSILFRTSLLQVSEKDGFGRTIKFTIHDLVYDFVEEAAKESIFLVPSAELRTGRESLLKPRTLILSDGLAHDLPIVRKSLRVLVVDDEDVKELPTTIGKLKLLRYLDISRTSITELPNPITRLYNLQTMKLSNLQQLPKNFGNLANLRHLCIEEDGIINGKPCLLPDIGQLSSLQTLPFFYVSRDKGCQIDQLGHLHNLRGDLKIFDLQNVSNQEEAIKAKISTKINLDSLELHWDTRTRDGSTDEDVLKGLEPHPNLKGFTVENFMGQSLPLWMLTTSHPLVFRNLEKIVLRNFNKCQQIPPLWHLPHLNIVNIIGMKSINCISTDFFGWKNVDDASSSNPSGLGGDAVVSFPALKELNLDDMPDLKEWSGLMCHDSSHSLVKIFPSLEILKVKICPKLVSLPDGVWLNLRCIKQLHILQCNSLSHLPKDVGGLASLELLTVVNCPNLVSIPDIHSLRSLVILTLAGCDNLRSLPSGMEVCTSIRIFTLLGFPAIQPEDLHPLSRMIQVQGLLIGGFSHDLDYFPWPSYAINPCRVTITNNENKEFQHPFASLLSLVLWGWQAVTSLPEQIQHLSNLAFLQIAHFDGIVALPEFLGSIHSLEQLHIEDCKNLLYLPSAEAMRRLTKLRKLLIEQCPLLKDRCKKEIGQEWYKIAHIPEIQLLP
ncbi:unnamed protein product [Coffea canephora]|uniref:Rx N-terminal domain-containing protein n=1 Tax=Coffea canephora TaxID=49390 RepID=A0A068UKG1_COFCA|nr:unnamed protein product [Coffea canephora]